MIEGTKCKYVRHFKVNIRIWIGSFIQASADSISGLLLFVAKESSTDISVVNGESPGIIEIQAEPYLHSGMGQVSFYQEALKIFFSKGVDLNRYKDTWPMDFSSL